MEKKYLEIIKEQYDEDIVSIKEWEDEHIDNEVFPLYKNILSYLFHKPGKVEHYSDSVKTDLYSFLHKVCGSGDDLKDFVLLLQSFLSNAVLDDSYFKITWTKTWHNPKDRRDFDIHRRVICLIDDEHGDPCVTWARDDKGSQDIKLLEEAFNIVIEREKKRYERIF